MLNYYFLPKYFFSYNLINKNNLYVSLKKYFFENVQSEASSIHLYEISNYLIKKIDYISNPLYLSHDGKNAITIIVCLDMLLFCTDRKIIEFELEYFEKHFSNDLKILDIVAKDFLQMIVTKRFTENIMEFEVSGEDVYDYFDTHIINGDSLQYTSEFKNVMSNEVIGFEYVKFQPYRADAVVTIRSQNIIEFSQYIDEIKLILLIQELAKIAQGVTIKHEKY